MNVPAGPTVPPGGHRHGGSGHGGHGGWAMLLCCIPMVIAIVAIIIGGR